MARERPRLFYIDNLRILLTVVVMLHHLAITYGAPGDWPYREGQPDALTSIVFALFGALNDAFMMGFFFALIVSTIAGAIGWWIGQIFGIAFALVLSSVTSVIGYWYGLKWNREYFG